MKVLKIGMGGAPYYIASDIEEAQQAVIEAFSDDLEDNIEGVQLTMEIIEMAEEELDGLPEFQGF